MLRHSLCVLAGALLCVSTPSAQIRWVAQAPGPTTSGQVENIDEGEVAGAVKAVAVDPVDANIVYVAAINGGVWRTSNAMVARPHWEPLTDREASLSMGAIEFDPTDTTHRTLLAGHGRFSSMARAGGALTGLLRTTDGGNSWQEIRGPLVGANITAVAARGATLLVTVDGLFTPAKAGLWRSGNTGATWKQLSADSTSGFPAGAARDLAGHPSTPDRFFAAGSNGIYKSTDGGAKWARTGTAEMHRLVTGADNVKIATAPGDTVYVAISQNGFLAGVFATTDAGTNWTSMGMPQTPDGVGLHFGGQGDIHLSLAADPTSPQIVYIGGDIQPLPNTLGAVDYTGRLFRGDRTRPAATRWVHLTHSRQLGAAGGGTANGSAPHGDSRDMAVAANGVLIEVDDGGVYRRTEPRTNGGDWFSMNGDLQVTELHSVAWDSLSKLVVGGAQDTGTPLQRVTNDVRWGSISTGDGGCVAVDNTTSAQTSTRFSSHHELRQFRREVYNASNVRTSRVPVRLLTPAGVAAPSPSFYTPVRLNAANARRLIVGASNGVYESSDQGDTAMLLTPAVAVNTTGPQIIAYGASGNEDILYVGGDASVFVRTGAPPAQLTASTAYRGGTVLGIALGGNTGDIAYVVDEQRVFRTTNAGGAWSDISGNLNALRPGTLRSIAFGEDSVFVGSDLGVFVATRPSFNVWAPLGADLPRVPVYHLEYNATDRVLVAGTFGRGAWTIRFSTPPVGTAADGSSPVRPAARAQPPTRNQPPQAPPPPPPETRAGIQLHPGVVIDPARGQAVVMAPDGGVEAVALTSGQSVWRTSAAARPLGLADGRIVTQAENPTATNRLDVVVLDSATGAVVTRGSSQLEGVTPTVTDTARGSFVAAVRPDAADFSRVVWEFVQRPPRTGMKRGTGGLLSPPAVAPAAAQQPARGQLRLNLRSGQMQRTDGAVEPVTAGRPVPLPVAESTAPAPEPEFLSSDGRHFLRSELVAPAEFERYMLRVFDRATRDQVGQFRSHLAFVPFYVTGELVVFTTEPYARVSDGKEVNEPLMLRAVTLSTGQPTWARPVRDTTYRGPETPTPR